MLTVGTLPPPFALPDQDGVVVTNDSLRGRWAVLYFYPRDDTPGCTIEACEFTAALPDFRGLGGEVFGCSADAAQAHLKFIAKHRLGIRLLTDADKSVMKAFGAYGKKLMYGKPVEGVIRSTVLLAPDGTVAHHWATVKAAGHAEQVRQKLAELQGGAVAPKAKAASKAKPAAKAKAPAKAVAKTVAKTVAKPAKRTAKPAKAAAKSSAKSKARR
jgi:peroxiredoxin Q/BCP